MRSLAVMLALVLGCDARAERTDVSTVAPAPIVTLTDDAVELLRRYAGDRRLEDLYILVAINFDKDDPFRTGKYYRFFLDVNAEPVETAVELRWKGLRFHIDRASAPFLQGTVISTGTAADGSPAFRFTSPLLPSSYE
jgi:hypothetical protein